MFDKIAEELKNARIQSGFTLLQIAAKSRIDIRFLELMENGNFSFLPELYVKAFLKDYAGIVGLNVDLILKKYEAAKIGKNYEETDLIQEAPKKEVKKVVEAPKPETQQPITYNAVSRSVVQDDSASAKKKKNMVYAVTILGAAAFITLIIIMLTRGNSEIIVPEKPIEEVIEQNKQRYVEEPKGKDANLKTNNSTDSLSLLIKANDTSWVKIILDNKSEEEFILFPKSQKVIAAVNNYKIIFGNSGAIELQLNNKSLNFSGKKKEIRYIQIDSSGLQYLNSQPVLE